MSEEIDTPSVGVGRRDFMKKSAIVGGMVWAAPAMTTLGSRAFAFTPGPDDCDVDLRMRILMDGNGNFTGFDSTCADPQQPVNAECILPAYQQAIECVQDDGVSGGVLSGTFSLGSITVTREPDEKIKLTLTNGPLGVSAVAKGAYANSVTPAEDGCFGAGSSADGVNEVTLNIGAFSNVDVDNLDEIIVVLCVNQLRG